MGTRIVFLPITHFTFLRTNEESNKTSDLCLSTTWVCRILSDKSTNGLSLFVNYILVIVYVLTLFDLRRVYERLLFIISVYSLYNIRTCIMVNRYSVYLYLLRVIRFTRKMEWQKEVILNNVLKTLIRKFNFYEISS